MKLALFLESKGHDLRIVAGDRLPYPLGLQSPPLRAPIFRGNLRDLEAPVNFARRILTSKTPSQVAHQAGDSKSLMAKSVGIYRSLVAIPDGQAGWYPAALEASKQAIQDWTPDVIISSALPFTAHAVASRIARRIRKPWVAEFRDLFTGNPYTHLPGWRQSLDRKIEKAVMAPASAIVGLTPQIAHELELVHKKPTYVVMNGYDELEENVDVHPPIKKDRPLNILYTGIIYPGRRDPSSLFQAIRLMGDRGRRVTVAFYGQDLRGVREAALEAGVASQVTVHEPVSYYESLRLQRAADVLLLLLWDDPRERGTLTGKVFEYIGTNRPILAIGCQDGIASTLVRNRGLGITASDPASVAHALSSWLDQIDADGMVPFVPASARKGLSRNEQFGDYEQLLRSLTL